MTAPTRKDYDGQVICIKAGLFLVLFFGSLTDAVVPNYAEVTLRNHLGKNFSLKDFQSDYILLTFFYSTCPISKMCPLSIRKSKLALEFAKKSKLPMRIIGVTLDPMRDTSSVLMKYAQREGVDPKLFWFATADSTSAIDSITSNFNVIGIASGQNIPHNVRSVLLGPSLQFLRNFDENEWTPEDVVRAIKTDLSKESGLPGSIKAQ